MAGNTSVWNASLVVRVDIEAVRPASPVRGGVAGGSALDQLAGSDSDIDGGRGGVAEPQEEADSLKQGEGPHDGGTQRVLSKEWKYKKEKEWLKEKKKRTKEG